MTITAQSNKACDLILFGTKGDLARRKLLPALYQLERAGLLHADTRIIGVARDELSLDGYSELVESNLQKFVKEPLDADVMARMKTKLHYVQIDLSKEQDYLKLKAVTDISKRIPVSYFATAPSLFGNISKGLHLAGLSAVPSRVVLEKPIGHCLESSKVINDQVAEFFQETQIYRIDHYLGKETVLNLLALRFANAIFASNWDHNAIDHVQISVAEEVGVEGRWGYYDDAGQMRDMVQNHLLQVLSLIAMEPPARLDADSIRDEKLKVLKALRPINLQNVQEKTVRGQYAAGFVGGKPVPGYLGEEDARPNSKTETFVAIKVDIDNWRWAGVPFYLRTGKRMPNKVSEVVICFKPQPHNIFHETYKQLPANKLIIRLQPDEGVEIQIMNKIPGLGETMQLQQSKLDLSFDETFQAQRIADAYERLLLEAMLGNQYLFVRRDEVEQAWKWVDGILDAWRVNNEPPKAYQAGTWGPVAAISLLARDDRNWDE
ncbi:MAG: glucose-6-phosphate dehydrogenase [Rheinheimera sp.]|nr:glucose-6-phosphate dehydrogenase [Gammaproteobacteria bacterium]MDZ7901514.1 glucose-6-phosphate dehydrogenase [Rheinheimera sp.]